MSTPLILLPSGIDPATLAVPQILRMHDYETREDGLTTAVVEYFCYPPDTSRYPKAGAKHPIFKELVLEAISVRQNGFVFIQASYVGLIGTPTPVTEQDTQIMDGGLRMVETELGINIVTTRIKRVVNRTRGVAKSPPSSPSNGGASWVKRGNVYHYTRETITPDQIIVP